MLERIHTGDYRTTPFEARQSEPRDDDRESYVPLYLSDSDGEPQPDEYISPSVPSRRRLSISSRILAVVCMAAAAAVLFALFSSDAMRDFVNVKASMASVASIFPAPSEAAPVIAMANVAPTREDMRNAYQSALQGQAPAAAALAEPQVQVQIQAPLSPPHRIDPSEVAAALTRADTLIAGRDIAAARLVLQRVANDGDAQAAVILAETYDPEFLERLGAFGMASDIAMARQWYETAAKLGSAEAGQRLAVLATTNR